MNTTITTAHPSRHHTHPPSPALTTRSRAQRVGLIDRLALRLGVALVAWSRRPRELDSRESRARRVGNALSTERRERHELRQLLVMLPPR
jgi:hypothetical protein